MGQLNSAVPQLFTSLNDDFISSKNDLIDAIEIIMKNTRDSIINSQTKMESCIDAIANDYVTFKIRPESSVDPCKPIKQQLVDEYNQCLNNLYIRANVGYNKIIDNYEEGRLAIIRMVHDLKRKIETFYNEIQIGLEEVIRNSTRSDLLVALKNHERIHVRKCNKFKNEVDKLFYKVNRKCISDIQEFDKNINKLISIVTHDHRDILQKYKIIKLTVCSLESHKTVL